jgi:anti-sigma regulatory factor (Ser/Thr protein kinase)
MKQADIVLPGLYSEYESLRRFISSFAQGEGYSALFIEGLQLTLKEAFVNAIRHGNKEQSDLTVSIRLLAEEGVLLASVKDCGKGFNPDELPNPVNLQNLFKLSGRGIYIIRSIAEIISLENDLDGSTLTLRYIPC